MNLHDHIDALQSVLTDVVPNPDERLRLAIITAGTQNLIERIAALIQHAKELAILIKETDEDDILFNKYDLLYELQTLTYWLEDINLESCLTPLDSHALLQENAA